MWWRENRGLSYLNDGLENSALTGAGVMGTALVDAWLRFRFERGSGTVSLRIGLQSCHTRAALAAPPREKSAKNQDWKNAQNCEIAGNLFCWLKLESIFGQSKKLWKGSSVVSQCIRSIMIYLWYFKQIWNINRPSLARPGRFIKLHVAVLHDNNNYYSK